MTRHFSGVIERDEEGYYVGSVPALPGCHSQAKSLDHLMNRMKAAIELCLGLNGEGIGDLDFVGVQKVMVES